MRTTNGTTHFIPKFQHHNKDSPNDNVLNAGDIVCYRLKEIFIFGMLCLDHKK